MNDLTRAAVIATLNSLFPVLNIIGVLDLTGDQVSIIMLFANNLITLLALTLKFGQQSSGSTSTVSATITTAPAPPPAGTGMPPGG